MRLVCSVSTTCLRASSACVCSRSWSISLICSSSLAISVLEQLVAALLVLDLRREDHVDEPDDREAEDREADGDRDELALARLALLLAVRQQVDADHSKLRIARPQAISSSGASWASCRGRMLSATAMVPNGFATTVATPARLATSSSSPGRSAPPPASTI